MPKRKRGDMVEDKKLPILASVDTCTLCGSCYNACPTDAITFSKEHLDFFYPLVNEKICIGCKKCQYKCPVVTPLQVQNTLDNCTTWIARNPDPEIRMKSTSGGVFYAVAQHVIQKGGYVCGAVFDDKLCVKHICSNQISDVYKMMGSKYAQSDMGNVYQQVMKLVEKRVPVLFTGCPCQVAGLNAILGKSYECLVTMEVICHGIPSGHMLKSYIKLLSHKYKSEPITFNYRDKASGWHSCSVRAQFKNGTVYCKPTTADAYMRGFLGNTFLKPACFKCTFRGFRSNADCMIGDFWGAEVEAPNLDDNTGLSCVLVHNQNVIKLLRTSGVELYNAELNQILKYNRNILESPNPSDLRDEFYDYAEKTCYQRAIQRYFWETPVQLFRRKLRYYSRCIYYRLRRKSPPLY